MAAARGRVGDRDVPRENGSRVRAGGRGLRGAGDGDRASVQSPPSAVRPRSAEAIRAGVVHVSEVRELRYGAAGRHRAARDPVRTARDEARGEGEDALAARDGGEADPAAVSGAGAADLRVSIAETDHQARFDGAGDGSSGGEGRLVFVGDGRERDS